MSYEERATFWGMVRKVIRQCDIIIEVVDARFPFDSRNFPLEEEVKKKGKKLIVVINKADLVPVNFVEGASKTIGKEYPCIYLSSHERHGTRNLIDVINHVRMGEDVKIGVVGYPNTGKSTVINVLRGRHSAPTSPIPGHTRSIQWIRVAPKVMMMDTPGVLPYKSRRELFALGAMSVDKARNVEETVNFFISDLVAKKAGHAFVEKYGLELEPAETYLDRFCEKYKLLARGGVNDTERAAKRIFNDWLKGKIKAYWK